MAAVTDLAADLRAFHDIPPPADPPEYRFAARLVKGLAYVAAAFPIAVPLALAGGVLLGVVPMSTIEGNWLLLLAILGAIPAFVLLAYAYPAFVEGERWSLWAIAMVGLGLAAIAPARFFTEAASITGAAIPPTRVEWVVFLAALGFLYFLLSPETRAGMQAARARNALRAPPAATGTARYVCPECGRVFHLGRMPPAGTLCPRCRRA